MYHFNLTHPSSSEGSSKNLHPITHLTKFPISVVEQFFVSTDVRPLSSFSRHFFRDSQTFSNAFWLFLSLSVGIAHGFVSGIISSTILNFFSSVAVSLSP